MPNGQYFMTYVAQENPAGIKYMISDRINHFDDYHAQQIDTERGGCEAPNVWKRIGEDKWVIMYDIYSLKPLTGATHRDLCNLWSDRGPQ
jgi:hypothetical protein